MEHMIDKDLIKKLRKERAWSQDHLALVSGISLRTVQRIENEGRCSLESKKALAVAFEINAVNLDVKPVEVNTLGFDKRGRMLGISGAFAGLISAYVGITMSFASGNISSGEAGLYYGGIGALCGICCAVIGVFANKQQTVK